MLNYKQALYFVLLATLCSCGTKSDKAAEATADSTAAEVPATPTVTKSADFEAFLAPFKPISFPQKNVDWYGSAEKLPRIEQRLALKFIDRDNMDTSMFNQSKFSAYGKVMENDRFTAVIHVIDTGDGISYELATYSPEGKLIAKESVGGMPSYGEISETSIITFQDNVLRIESDFEATDPGDPDPGNVDKSHSVTTIQIANDGKMTITRQHEER